MKKVLLLRPPSKLLRTLPIGLLYLSSYLEKRFRGDIEGRILDFRLMNSFNLDEIERKISSSQAEIIGISSLNIEIDETLKLARFIKKKFNNSKLILGGPLAFCEYDLVSKLNIFDYIVVGEGEEVLTGIIEDHLPKNTKILFAKDYERIDVNYIDFPDYNLVDLKQYFNLESHEVVQIHKKAIPIFTSRGCPYNCGFCCHIFGRKVRYRKLENIISEIEYLVTNFKIKELHIVDDIFNLNRKRLIDFFNLLNEKRVSLLISFPNGLRCELLDEEIIKIFKKNNVHRVCLGIESASEKIMNLINKKHDLKKLQKLFFLLDKYNIIIHGLFITGFPTEDLDDFKESLNFINKSKLHTYRMSRFNAFRNTDLCNRFSEKLNTKNISQISTSYYSDLNFSSIPNNVLKKLEKQNILKFYLNPVRIYRILLVVNKKVLIRKIFKILHYLFTAKWPEGIRYSRVHHNLLN